MDDDLFAAAGIVLPRIRGKRPQKHAVQPSPYGCAASGRLVGARRSRPAPRNRIGPARDHVQVKVIAFPLSRNGKVVSAMNERVPATPSSELASICNREAQKLEKRLVYKGIDKKSARRCAMDLLHEVYMKRVIEADGRP